ncbi:MAG TPA: hypothetical protein VH458_03055 [Vicinamibacterales bacterium]|jgi:hypothetical protein
MPIVMVALLLAALQPSGAKSLQVSQPVSVVELDTGKLKGEPTQLGWSPDGSKFLLQMSDHDAQGMVRNPHVFVIDASGGKPQPVETAPEWATSYWAWKSNKFAPGSNTFAIDIKQEIKSGIATSSPMGGSLARGGSAFNPDGGTSVDDVSMRAQQMQKQLVITLTLKNEVVGEFVNQQFLPGYTFGWAPQPLSMIAYCTQTGHMAVMDEQGQKQELAGTRDAILPAWSADGSRIAYLQKTGKKKYTLRVMDIKQ